MSTLLGARSSYLLFLELDATVIVMSYACTAVQRVITAGKVLLMLLLLLDHMILMVMGMMIRMCCWIVMVGCGT